MKTIINEQGLPFGLCSKEVQNDLEEAAENGALVELYNHDEKWHDAERPKWATLTSYRATILTNPKPIKRIDTTGLQYSHVNGVLIGKINEIITHLNEASK